MGALQKFPLMIFKYGITRMFSSAVMHNGLHLNLLVNNFPFYDYERQCTITADAIIDNRKELFERLQSGTS